MTSSPPLSTSPYRTDSIDDLLSLERIDSEGDSPLRKQKRGREEGSLSDVGTSPQRRHLDSGSRVELSLIVEPANLVGVVDERGDTGALVGVT